MRDIWAVVCGAIRSEFELYNILSLLCEWRKEKLIHGIVISTWKNELEKIKGLRAKCQYLGISVVESMEIDQDMAKFRDLDFYRQIVQLNAVVMRLPDDAWVLKCRTDNCIDALVELKIAFKEDLKTRNFGFFHPICVNKIAVCRYSIFQSFWSEDLAFFAHVKEMKKIISLEDTELYTGRLLRPDERFFINPFLHNYPIISSTYRMVKKGPYNRALHKIANSNFAGFENGEVFFPGVINKFYAFYYVVLYQNFKLCNRLKYKERIYSLNDLFSADHEIGTLKDKKDLGSLQYGFFNAGFMEDVVLGRLRKTKGYLLLYDEIKKIQNDIDYLENINVTFDDYIEAAKWGEKYLKLRPSEWLNWNVIKVNNKSSIDGCMASKILFSNYNLDDKVLKVIDEIPRVVDASVDLCYYELLKKALPTLKVNMDIYDLALAASARILNYGILLSIANKLYLGEVSRGNVDTLRYIIERFRSLGWLFNVHSKDGFLFFYVYGKYCEARGDGFFGETINRLSVLWKVDFVFDRKDSFEKNYIDFLNYAAQKFIERKNKHMNKEIMDALKNIEEKKMSKVHFITS